MTRDEFNNLSINDQVEYFNSELSKVKNFNSICKDIGISKNTIKKRFTEARYVPMCKGKTNIIIAFSVPGDVIEDVAIEDTDNVIKQDPEDIKEILKRLETLEREVSEIKCSNNAVVNDFVVKSFDGELITRAFKLDIEVIEELEKIFEKYSTYKIQDIINTLLLSAINNIK